MKRKTYSRIKKLLSVGVALVILGGMIPDSAVTSVMDWIFGNQSARADEGSQVLGTPQVHTDQIPDCPFEDELYDGTNKPSKLPKTAEYQTGHEAPKHIPLKDFQAQVGTGADFQPDTAASLHDQGDKIMICDAEDLYTLSRITNLCDGAQAPERSFYLSSDIVLGNNIEYSEIIGENKLFMPIGADDASANFTGAFDGQGFEIRDLYFASSESYTYYAIGLFAVVGGDAVVGNFGICHPTIQNNTATAVLGGVCAINKGTISDVYVIINEYDHEEAFNMMTSDNAVAVGGIAGRNEATGIIKDSYDAVRFDATTYQNLHLVCAVNNGTVSNCYYDSELFATSNDTITTPDDTNMKPLSNIYLKRPGYYSEGMINTKFKPLRCGQASDNIYENYSYQYYWQYPRLYGYEGTGGDDKSLVISTPAQLINFPCCYEYYSTNRWFNFRLGACIDMSEAAPNAYKPQLNYSLITNQINGTSVLKKEYHGENVSNYSTRGYTMNRVVLSGTADPEEHDANCKLKHISHGTDGNGNELAECHMIYNLTIDTPACSDNIKGIHNEPGDEWYITGLFAAANESTIRDLMIVGGNVSTGDHDLLKSDESFYKLNNWEDPVFYVFNSPLCGYGVSNVKFYNVQTSADLSLGSGRQFATAMGGLVAGGSATIAQNCSNSGDIIGGYKEIDESENVLNAVYAFGGLFGSVTTGYSAEYSEYNANYGNVYATVLIGDESDAESFYCRNTNSVYGGITGGEIGYNARYLWNEGMIFDAPVEQDENGAPVFDPPAEEGGLSLPRIKAVPDGKVSINNYLYMKNGAGYFETVLVGVGNGEETRSTNAGNIYACLQLKTDLTGVGGNGQFCCNKGDIIVTSGARYVSGVGRTYGKNETFSSSYENCYNGCNYGNIYIDKTNTRYGINIRGVSLRKSQGSYNSGNITVAPSTGSGGSFYVSGCSESGGNIEENADKQINVGNITVDLKKYGYHNLDENYKYCYVNMQGTGASLSSENYGIMNFINHKNEDSFNIYLSIAGCSTGGGILNNSRNYADIFVDGTGEITNFSDVKIYEIGPCHVYSNYPEMPYVRNVVNYGDLAFSGQTYSLTIFGIGSDCTNNMCCCANFGNISVLGGTYCGGTGQFGTIGSSSGGNSDIEDILFGWYEGCTIPRGLQGEEYQDIFAPLDPAKRYGNFDIQGNYHNVKLAPYWEGNSNYPDYHVERLINNGSIYLHNAEMRVCNNYGSSYHYKYYICGVSNGKISHSENHGPITVSNVGYRFEWDLWGCGRGSYNGIL